MWNYDTGTFITVSFFIFLLAILVGTVLVVIRKNVKKFLVIQKHKCIKFCKDISKRFKLSIFLFKNTSVHDYNYANFVFDSFIFFYENTLVNELENLEFPVNSFPRGVVDIVEIYRYVSKIRHENFSEYYKIVSNGHLKVWGLKSTSFTSKRSGFYIKITPIIGESSSSITSAMVSLENLIYEIDTEVAVWIVERRKFFGI